MKKIYVYNSIDEVIAAEDFEDVSAGSRIMIKTLPGVSIGAKPRSDGRYQGYCSNEGVKTYFYGRSPEEVAVKIRDFLKKGGKVKRKKRKDAVPTFGEYAKKWYELYKEPLLKPTSLRTLQYAVKPAVEAWSNRKISDITLEDAQEVANSIESAVFRKLFVSYVRDIFKRAMRSGYVKANPIELVEIKPPRKKHKKALTIEEQAMFVEAMRNTQYDLLTRFLLATGLRIGEALALTKADIHDCHVHVAKNLVRIDNKDVIQDAPKTDAGNRIVPISETMQAELLSQPEDRIFKISATSMRGMYRRKAAALGFEVTPHTLRHTYATRLEEAGVPEKVAQYLMGHASIQMTKDVYTDAQQRYVRAYDKKVIFAIDCKHVDF